MMWFYAAAAIFLAWMLIYNLIPDLFLHYLGLGSWKRQYTPGVAFTFDDGPNPRVTPGVLDILDKYQVKAAFFIVGQRAELYPDLVRMIHDRGHKIGVHSHSHRFAWFLSPRQTWQEWEQSVKLLEAIVGQPITWIRPPWGTYNLATWWWLKRNHKQAIMWTAEGHDWNIDKQPIQIIERILKSIHDGSIILLHDDGGDKGAPFNTLQALEELCARIIGEKKLPLVELSLPSWPWPRRLLYRFWSSWERMFAQLYKIERISAFNVFRLSRARHRGPELRLPDGQIIARRGDTIGEIHFDSSRMFYDTSSPGKKGAHIIELIRTSLPEMARFVADHPEYDGISAFAGLTLLDQGVKRFGFQVQEVPPRVFTRWLGKYQQLIMRVYHNSSPRSLRDKYSRQPRLVWMSRQQLMDNWL